MLYTRDNLDNLSKVLPEGNFECTFTKQSKEYKGLLVKDYYCLYLKSDVLAGGGSLWAPYKYSWILDNGYETFYRQGNISSINVLINNVLLGEL